MARKRVTASASEGAARRGAPEAPATRVLPHAAAVVRRSILFSTADRYFTQVLLVATTAVMARLLTPAETGIYLLANGVMLLAETFRAFGTSVYIVQETDLTRGAVRSAFTVTFILSLLIAVAIYLVSDSIARFYGEPGLGLLLRVAALGFLAVPFGGTIVAMLQRDLAFNTLAVINIVTAVATSAVTIALGIAGFGAVSYAWAFVVSGVVLALTAFALRPHAWVFRPSLQDFRRVVSFGAVTSGVGILNTVCDVLPRFALGKLLGFGAVGLYGRALTVCQLPDRVVVQALQPVVLPAMAAHARAGGSLKDAYLRGHGMMSAIQWPALVVLALLADPVVRLLLGSQWTAAAPLVRLISLGNLALAPAFMTFPVLVATGRIRDTLTSSLLSLPPSVGIVIAAAWWGGVTAVAASTLVVAPLQMFVALYFVRRAIGLRWGEFVAASRASACVTLGAALVPACLIALSPDHLTLGMGETVAAVAGAALGWLLALRAVRHPVGAELLGLACALFSRVGWPPRPAPAPTD